MNEMPVSPEPQRRSNTGLIIGIVSVVLLCCCCIGAVLAWNYGDLIMQSLGM